MNKKIWQRFEELENMIKDIDATQKEEEVASMSSVMFDSNETEIITYIDNNLFLQWKIQIEDLLMQVSNKESVYYKEFINIKNSKYGTNLTLFQEFKVIFLTLKNDYKKGYLSSIKTLVQAEVFETQLEQAEELLKNGYTVASAVIAGTVLETALREICLREGVEDGMINKMNDNLAKKGVYNKLQQKRIVALADIRNSSAHGNADKFEKKDVEMMIRDIEDFLLKYLDDV